MPPGTINPLWPEPDDGPAGRDDARSARGFQEDLEPTERSQDSDLWVAVDDLPRESWWVRARRVLIGGVAVVVIVVGVVNVGETITTWVSPTATPAAPAVTDQQYSGIARLAALDYLSWDSEAKSPRQAALARYAGPGATRDGWDGEGRQWADASSVLDVVRDGERVIATVRVRVTPAAEAPNRGDATQQEAPVPPNAAAAPAQAAGDNQASARWVTLGVPLAEQQGRPVVTAAPVLLGSSPSHVPRPVGEQDAAAIQDKQLTQSTKDSLTRLLRAYASGDLSYARSEGTSFSGLGGGARLVEIENWQLLPQGPDQTARREGTATVTWELAGGAGQLTGTYRITLEQQQNRWYLASIAPNTKDGSR